MDNFTFCTALQRCLLLRFYRSQLQGTRLHFHELNSEAQKHWPPGKDAGLPFFAVFVVHKVRDNAVASHSRTHGIIKINFA